MAFNFFCHVDTISWHLLENTGTLHLRGMVAKYFQIITHNWRCTHVFHSHCIVTIHACHNSLSRLQAATVATGLPHLSFAHATSTVRLVTANSGQHILGFNLIFISPSWSMYSVLLNNIIWQDWHFFYFIRYDCSCSRCCG